MSPDVRADVHPRELELAKILKDHGIEWEVRTGDWFHAEDAVRHYVLEVEHRDGQTLLHGKNDNSYNKDDVIWLPHLTDCRQWLMDHDWEFEITPPRGGTVTITALRRHTSYAIHKTEPTELAAACAAVAEVLDLIHFGWA